MLSLRKGTSLNWASGSLSKITYLGEEYVKKKKQKPKAKQNKKSKKAVGFSLFGTNEKWQGFVSPSLPFVPGTISSTASKINQYIYLYEMMIKLEDSVLNSLRMGG